jgi:dCTP diphosphatase
MKELEREIHKYMKARKWDKLRPSDMAKSISIEAAELLELFQWVDMDLAETKKDKEKLGKLKKELADIFIYCIELSVSLGLDTKKIIRDKLKIIEKKYPAALVRKHVDHTRPGTEKFYEQIKEEWRRREGK